MTLALPIAAGLLAGLAAGALYLALLRRSIRAFAARPNPRALLLAAPLRVALPAIIIAALARWSPAAALAALAALALTIALLRTWSSRQLPDIRRTSNDPPAEPPP